jgi:glycosyltransferase involved in cell wall biosynthesis
MRSAYNKKPIVSVVIRSYNEEKHIGRLLHGISQQTLDDIIVVIVDSGSTDGTLAIASRFPVKIVNIRPENFSFGRSLNLGCAATTSEFIVIASAHVYPVYRNWIEQLLAPFQDSKVGMVYGKQQGGETTKFAEHQIFARWFPDQSTPAQNHPFCNNANAAIRRVLWNQFLYNEEITGLEDLELANRVLKAGYRLAYQAGAAVVHLHDEIYAQIYNRYRREAMAFKRIFPIETFFIKDFLRLFVSNTVSDYKHALRNGARSRDFYEIPLFRFLQFYGTYQGFKDSGSITSRLKQTFYYPNGTKAKAPPAVIRPEDPMLINYQTRRRSYRENR